MTTPLYPWLKKHWLDLQGQIDAGRLHHAIFITSANGMGKLALAQQLAQTLLCKEPVGWEPCQTCHACQLFTTSVHPDYQLVSSEAGKVIPVDRIRSISKQLNERSQLSGNKVVIIEHAESFNMASANALLKTLEEPTEGSYLILLAENKSQVLPTINSRCQKLHISAPTEQQTLDWLISQFPITAASIAAIRINQGAPLHTLSYLNKGDDELRIDVFSLLANIHSQPDSIAKLTEIFSDASLERLTWLQFILLDLQKYQAGIAVTHLINPDQSDWYQQLAQRLTSAETLQVQKELLSLKDTISSNSNLTLDTLLLTFFIKLKRIIN